MSRHSLTITNLVKPRKTPFNFYTNPEYSRTGYLPEAWDKFQFFVFILPISLRVSVSHPGSIDVSHEINTKILTNIVLRWIKIYHSIKQNTTNGSKLYSIGRMHANWTLNTTKYLHITPTFKGIHFLRYKGSIYHRDMYWVSR